MSFIWMASVNADYLHGMRFEIGDLAANSLLVQQAKNFELLVGNYSRIGFNHPGPAFLYVLAAGESFLFDRLGLVESPIAGQLLAACLLSSAWVGLVFTVLRRLLPDTLEALAATASFLAAIVMLEPQALGGMWFPFLYILPFGAFTLSVARLISGSLDCLWVTAVSSGFLIHGHAAFVAMIALMLAGGIAFSVLFSRSRQRASAHQPGQRVVWKWPLTAAVVIWACFALPIALNTWLNYPGEIPKYLTYGQHAGGNGWLAAIGFVGRFWGGAAAALMGATLVAFLITPTRSAEDAYDEALRALGVAVVLATASLLFYARRGIDELSHLYTGLFYYSSVAIVISASLILLFRQAKWRTRRSLLWLAGIAATATISIGTRPAEIASRADIPKISEALLASQAKTLRLDLDNTNEWPLVWSVAAGTAVALSRSGYHQLCIGENWHILFTSSLKCMPVDQDRAVFRLRARPTNGSDSEGAMQFGALDLVRAAERTGVDR
jgi:hypothetical protein